MSVIFVAPPPPETSNLISLMLDGDHTYGGSAPVTVTSPGGIYRAAIASGNANDTLWWFGDEGRMDYVTLSGDFDIVASNIGLASGSVDSQFQFCGLICWLEPLSYEFAVAGNRGGTGSTIEYKSTIAGSSDQRDIFADAITNDRCDLRVARVGSTVTFYYRQVGEGAEDWIVIPHSNLTRVNFGTGPVRVGLITYGFDTVSAFVGECASVEAIAGSPT